MYYAYPRSSVRSQLYVDTSQTIERNAPAVGRMPLFVLCVGLRLLDIGCRQLLGVSYWTRAASVLFVVQLVVQNTAELWR